MKHIFIFALLAALFLSVAFCADSSARDNDLSPAELEPLLALTNLPSDIQSLIFGQVPIELMCVNRKYYEMFIQTILHKEPEFFKNLASNAFTKWFSSAFQKGLQNSDEKRPISGPPNSAISKWLRSIGVHEDNVAAFDRLFLKG